MLLTFCAFWPALGLNISMFGGKKFSYVGDTTEEESFVKLLSQDCLSIKKQQRLALLCEIFPSSCIDRSLYSKINPNLHLSNGDNVLRLYLKRFQKGQIEFAPLLIEALEHPALNPHQLNSFGGDFALDILKGQEPKFVALLLAHKNFNPNTRYGKSNVPLAAELIVAKNFKALKMICKHPKFDNSVSDYQHIRPGYYLINDKINKYNRKRFRVFMGTELAQWNLCGLGLADAHVLDNLLQFVLRNNEERMLVLKKYIEQIMLRHEVEAPEHANSFKPIAILFGLDDSKRNIYIDESFTYQALVMLGKYGLLKADIKDDIYPSMFWLENTIKDLNIATVTEAREAHQGHKAHKHDKNCSVCLGRYKGTWFKSSTWCDHSICSPCFFACVGSATDKEEMICPARGCKVTIPPSLYLALSVEQFASDDQFTHLLEDYRGRILYHNDHCRSVLESVSNLKTCASCKLDFICNQKLPSPRKLFCPDCKALQVISPNPERIDLTHISVRGVWGYCDRCKNIIDKTAGCEGIYCVVCRANTTFIPIR